MTEIDLTPLKTALEEYIPQGRSALLPALYSAQNIYGFIPEPAAHEVAVSLKVPLADVYGVIDFYALFYREPVGKTVIHVCNDPACALAGSEKVLENLRRQYENLSGGEVRARHRHRKLTLPWYVCPCACCPD